MSRRQSQWSGSSSLTAGDHSTLVSLDVVEPDYAGTTVEERLSKIRFALSMIKSILEERIAIAVYQSTYSKRKKEMDKALEDLTQFHASLIAEKVNLRKKINERWRNGFLSAVQHVEGKKAAVWNFVVTYAEGDTETVEEEEFLESLRCVRFSLANQLAEKSLHYKNTASALTTALHAMQRASETSWKHELGAHHRTAVLVLHSLRVTPLASEMRVIIDAYEKEVIAVREQVESFLCASIFSHVIPHDAFRTRDDVEEINDQISMSTFIPETSGINETADTNTTHN